MKKMFLSVLMCTMMATMAFAGNNVEDTKVKSTTEDVVAGCTWRVKVFKPDGTLAEEVKHDGKEGEDDCLLGVLSAIKGLRAKYPSTYTITYVVGGDV